MEGDFAVFDHVQAIAEFGSDVDAEEYVKSIEGYHVPEYEGSVFVGEVPDDYPLWYRATQRLHASRNADLAVQRAIVRLRKAQEERKERSTHAAT